MPNTREKLIEILRGAINTHTEKKEQWILGGKVGEEPMLFGSFADHLIANGVTIATDNNVGDKKLRFLLRENGDIVPLTNCQQWIPVTERLPETDGHYLCNYHFGEYPKMTFTQVLDYYATDIVPHFQHTLGDGSMKVTHWMEIPQLPQPPKGD